MHWSQDFGSHVRPYLRNQRVARANLRKIRRIAVQSFLRRVPFQVCPIERASSTQARTRRTSNPFRVGSTPQTMIQMSFLRSQRSPRKRRSTCRLKMKFPPTPGKTT